MKRVICFGDFLVRLTAPGHQRFSQVQSYGINYTCAESNVCASLAVMGEKSAYVTRVPDNPIADAGLGELRRFDVDVSMVVRGGERMGLYYLEQGAAQRPSRAVYDRTNSGFTTSRRKDFDWKRIFKGADWFHFTGITPSLGGELPQILEDASREAVARGMHVSCDLNYRSRQWSVEEAARVLPRLVRHADCLFANAWDAENLLGVDLAGEHDEALAAQALTRAFPRLKAVAMTRRQEPSASDNVFGAALYAGGKLYRSRDYAMHLVDRVGGGDGFAAGLIYALRHRFTPQKAVEFAAAAGCLKHSIERDVNLATVEEIRRLAETGSVSRIQR